MCYTLLLSTNYPGDLAAWNDEFVRFSRALPGLPEVALLAYPQRWYVGSKSECSCTFRHLHSPELGFGEPVDWFPEEPDEIEATARFIKIVRGLVEDGYLVDVIDIWGEIGNAISGPENLEVDLAAVEDRAFRFLENYRLEFRIST